MNFNFKSKLFKMAVAAAFSASALTSCGDINNSWEVKGGGYFKYSVDGKGSYSIDLEKDDVEPPYYVNNHHHYFMMHTRESASDRGDQFSLMVNNPTTGKKLTPVDRANISGKNTYVSWMRAKNSTESPLIPDSSYVRFDEIINDSLWTANVSLYFKSCSFGACNDSLPPVHIEGRLRYWVPEDER